MRICHVSPHLPPDQAANAILPAELGDWLHETGHEVTFLSALTQSLAGILLRRLQRMYVGLFTTRCARVTLASS